MDACDRVIYHIYPLGTLGILDGSVRTGAGEPSPLSRIRDWIPAMHRIGANTLLLGPVFASERHGYDTVDLRRVDPRLGTDRDLVALSDSLRAEGIDLMLDAVLNHVGRSHPLVQEVARLGSASPRANWISGFDPSGSDGGLPFGYQGWSGHHDLVKLDTGHEEVRAFLTDSVMGWMDEFSLAGLRLDAADCIDRGFLRGLSQRCRARDPSFLLLGEAVQGELYAPLLREAGLGAVTDYEAYKSLWSAHNDRNCHELAWTLRRLFGAGGLCEGNLLQSFADNHDVDRVASTLRDPRHLYTLYGLLFSMPGIPSVHCGSEAGLQGRRTATDDLALRPALDPRVLAASAPHPDLAPALARFAAARRRSPAVRHGNFRNLMVEAQSLAFLRESGRDAALIAANIADTPSVISLADPSLAGRTFVDLLDEGMRLGFDARGQARLPVPPNWLRWLVPAD